MVSGLKIRKRKRHIPLSVILCGCHHDFGRSCKHTFRSVKIKNTGLPPPYLDPEMSALGNNGVEQLAASRAGNPAFLCKAEWRHSHDRAPPRVSKPQPGDLPSKPDRHVTLRVPTDYNRLLTYAIYRFFKPFLLLLISNVQSR